MLRDPEKALAEIDKMSAYQLIDLLGELYVPRCIGAHEDVEHAHRYAGAVELVQGLSELKQALSEA